MSSPKHALSSDALIAMRRQEGEVIVPDPEPMIKTPNPSMNAPLNIRVAWPLSSSPSPDITGNRNESSAVLRLLLTVFGGCLVLGLLFGDGAIAKLSIAAMLAGLGTASRLIYDAQNRKGNFASIVFLYCAGFVLLGEVVFFFNKLLSYAPTRFLAK